MYATDHICTLQPNEYRGMVKAVLFTKIMDTQYIFNYKKYFVLLGSWKVKRSSFKIKFHLVVF